MKPDLTSAGISVNSPFNQVENQSAPGSEQPALGIFVLREDAQKRLQASLNKIQQLKAALDHEVGQANKISGEIEGYDKVGAR